MAIFNNIEEHERDLRLEKMGEDESYIKSYILSQHNSENSHLKIGDYLLLKVAPTYEPHFENGYAYTRITPTRLKVNKPILHVEVPKYTGWMDRLRISGYGGILFTYQDKTDPFFKFYPLDYFGDRPIFLDSAFFQSSAFDMSERFWQDKFGDYLRQYEYI